MKKKLLIPIGLTVAAAIGCAASIFLGKNSSSGTAYAYIYQDGKEITRLPLDGSADGEIVTVTGENGEENVIEVKKSRVHMKSATCPDKQCVNMGWRERPDVPIVCLPHKVVIDIKEVNDGAAE